MTPKYANFVSSYSLCQKKKEIEAYLCEDDSKSELVLILSKIRRKTEELYALHKDFWKEFLKESIIMEKIERVIFRSSKLVAECDCIFNNLVPFYSQDKTALRIYAQYLVSFKANPELSNENFNKANLLEENECNRSTKKAEGESSVSEITTDGRENEEQTLEEFETLDPQTRKMIYSNALATPTRRTVFIILFVGFCILFLVALITPFLLSLIYSNQATSNLLHSKEACATIPCVTNLLLSGRGYQIIDHWMQSNITIEHNWTNDIYFDMDKYKQHVEYFTQSIVNLENVAFASKFSPQIYSQFTDFHYSLVIPTVIPGGGLYNLTESNKYPLSQINKILKLLANRFLSETSEALLQTYTSFMFMFLYRNQNTLTQAYSLFCHSYTQVHIDEALNSRNVLIIYTAAVLPCLLIVCVLYLIYSRFTFSRLKNHVKLLKECVSKPEVGEIYHTLCEQQPQEVITHAGKVDPLKHKICFPILIIVIFLTVGVCTAVFVCGLFDNTHYSVESFVNVQDVFETTKHLQNVAFYSTELYAYYRNVDDIPLITEDEALNMTLQYYQEAANLQRNWDWCLFGSTTKPFESVVAGMFPGTDHLIKGDPNCTIPETDTHFNSTCGIGIDTMLTHILLSTQILLKQNLLAQTILFQPVTIKEHITSLLKILFLFNLSSMKLIDFANIFAVDASVPNINYVIASFVIGFVLVTCSICSMYYIFREYANAEQQMRIMFDYLSIDTLVFNEKLKNFALFKTLPNENPSKLFTNNGVTSERDAKLVTILNTFVDGVITCNDTMLVDIFNPSAQRMFGYQLEDVIGKPIKIFTREHQTLVKNEVESIKKQVTKTCPKGETFELECVRKNQKTFPATVNIYVTFFENKHITLFFIKESTLEKKAILLLNEEKKKSENMLLNILPSSVARQLLAGASLIAEKHPDVTCFFSDMVEFTALTSQLTHTELVQLLNCVVDGFDGLTDKYNVEKIKTIGDSYFCCAGLNNVDINHPERILRFSIDCFNVIRNYNITSRKPVEKQINIRIGIHTGSVTAGVIGKKKFAYDLWGDNINTASRMESTSLPGRIQLSRKTYERVFDLEFTFEERSIAVKGKGILQTYLLDNKYHVGAIVKTEEINSII
ncbi:PAS domain-containing guanylate cyclase [Naegleria gruberi]|uniref:PAS domain-containing guanylate cyclase n=1 Tax=Naegleria gruberi TaxID=5762 RepID=D2VSH1_NAEGR|nr:PAS domain-containing guanylate cyclase [Naegleria gruberi]EFC40192.1 PAS domain-containing guanylate cyclase [Naegleria gruberi]|eukprot:XP_002672936.1 PAS domain-containing guanylate cyclase [Naegleria gruberi strain NEG-M]